MPLYEYVCLDCGFRFDELRSMNNADAPLACKNCNGLHTSRLLSLFFAHSSGRVLAGTSPGGCANCSSNACATCRSQ